MLKGRLGGFTLVETVVVIAAFSIILSVLLPALLSVGHVYRETEKANLLHIKSARAIDFIRDSVSSSEDLRIIADAPKPLAGYASIWCKDEKLYYQNPGKPAVVYMEDTSFNLSFTGSGRLLEIGLGVVTESGPYAVESAVSLIGTRNITGESGTGIQFKIIRDTD